MPVVDSYLTVARETRVEYVEQKSRFIGAVMLVASASEISEGSERIRKQEYSASHHCYAWRLGKSEPIQFKYSDDGEPNGTAGRPLYDLLAGRSLTNCLLVVTRYFGGTKLGTGGLARAYSEAGKLALDSAGIEEKLLCRKIRMKFDISLYDRWLRMIRALNIEPAVGQFSEQVEIVISVRLSLLETVHNQFTELTSGRGEYQEIDD